MDDSKDYVPYQDPQDFIRDSKKHGEYIYTNDNYRYDGGRTYYKPLAVDNTGVAIVHHRQFGGIDWFNLLKYYYWSDGTPCGKKQYKKI